MPSRPRVWRVMASRVPKAMRWPSAHEGVCVCDARGAFRWRRYVTHIHTVTTVYCFRLYGYFLRLLNVLNEIYP